MATHNPSRAIGQPTEDRTGGQIYLRTFWHGYRRLSEARPLGCAMNWAIGGRGLNTAVTSGLQS